MFEIVGRSLTGVTIKSNVSVAVPPFPSETNNVMVVVPVALAAGVSVTVRLAPLPPSTMLAFGTRAGLLEVAVTVKDAAAVSRSPTVKAMAPVAVSSVVDCSSRQKRWVGRSRR